MRTVLVTGPGGAGRTTVAAATALSATRRGDRTLLLSQDPALEAVLGARTGPAPGEPEAVAEGLWAARVDTAGHVRDEVLAFQERIRPVLDLAGARPLRGEEITELPGADCFALLHALRTVSRSPGAFDVVVVDMPPLERALAALALPGQLRRYLRRLLPEERRAARALRPVMAQLAGVPMPSRGLYEAAAREDAALAAVERVIHGTGTTLRLVAEPGPAAEEALRVAGGGLALYGLTADSLVANRVLPTGSPDPWLAALAGAQQEVLGRWHAKPEGRPETHEVPHLGREPRGLADLADLDVPGPAETPGVPGAEPADPWWVEDHLADEGLLVWCLPLPSVAKRELALARREQELLLTVGPFRRAVPLASALRRCTVTGAALTEGVLRVRFAPDPGLWPERGDAESAR